MIMIVTLIKVRTMVLAEYLPCDRVFTRSSLPVCVHVFGLGPHGCRPKRAILAILTHLKSALPILLFTGFNLKTVGLNTTLGTTTMHPCIHITPQTHTHTIISFLFCWPVFCYPFGFTLGSYWWFNDAPGMFF